MTSRPRCSQHLKMGASISPTLPTSPKSSKHQLHAMCKTLLGRSIDGVKAALHGNWTNTAPKALFKCEQTTYRNTDITLYAQCTMNMVVGSYVRRIRYVVFETTDIRIYSQSFSVLRPRRRFPSSSKLSSIKTIEPSAGVRRSGVPSTTSSLSCSPT